MTGQPHDPTGALAAVGISVPPMRYLGLETGPGIWAFSASATGLLPWWDRLRAAHSTTGLWPVILGPEPELGEVWETDEDPIEVMEQGLAMDGEVRLAQLRAVWAHDPPRRGDASNAKPHEDNDFVLAREDGWLGVIAAEQGYVVPALLTWNGASNHNLYGADHVPVLRYWHERFGAELVAMGWDILALRVARPPTDPQTMLAVAEEQYQYCPDAVFEVGTLDALAAIQVPSHRWDFWWD